MTIERYLVIDFEATCADDGSLPRHQSEIIEIGAVMAEASTFQVIDEFQSFIRPVRHPHLTAFCTQLTSITQAQVDAAPAFPEVVADFKRWLYSYHGFAFCSWGDYDFNQLSQDAEFHKIANPISARHINLKVQFRERQELSKKPGLGQAIAMAGLTFVGAPHRGIDDARNTARLLPFIFGEKTIPPARRAER